MPRYHEIFENRLSSNPDQVSINLCFDNQLAHAIEAGADIFLMPSLYEPCGLNQMYSLKYGTLPLVRSTGGLADTIEDIGIEGGTGTGCVFQRATGAVFLQTVRRAVDLYYNHSDVWDQAVRNAMSKDFSWSASAKKYMKLYRSVARG